MSRMEYMEESKESRRQRWIGIAVTILLVLSVAICLYTVVQVMSVGYVNLGGFSLFRVVTGSMEPTIPVGALMVSQKVDFSTVAVDDIICFRTQETAIWGKIVTHRVVGMLSASDGTVLLQTKGDANLVQDGYYVTQDNFIGKVIWHTADDSTLATIFSFFTSKIGFLGCIVFPCLLLAGLILRDSVKNIRTDLQAYVEEMVRLEETPEDTAGDSLEITQEEYDAMASRIRAELKEELMQFAEVLTEEGKTE